MEIAKSRLDWAWTRIEEFIAECDAFSCEGAICHSS